MARSLHVKPFMVPAVISTLALMLLIGGCGDGDDPGLPGGGGGIIPTTCPTGAFLTVSPIPLADLLEIDPLGNLNPPGHIAPTDHIGLTIVAAEGATAPIVTDLLCPGDLVVHDVSALQVVRPGQEDFLEFSINLYACTEIVVDFGHVTGLDTTLFGPLDGFQQWQLEGQSQDGDATTFNWHRLYDLQVAAGTRLGQGGGHVDQWGVDMGLRDLSQPPASMASSIWDGQWYLYARCPVSYFVPGAVHDDLQAKLAVPDEIRDDPQYGCGVLHEDIPGALQGVWFPTEGASMYAEERDVSFSHESHDPRTLVIAVGGDAAPSITSAVYGIDPVNSTGHLNRDFASVTDDGETYGYAVHHEWGELTIITRMVAPDTLWLEGLAAGLAETEWTFSDARSVFVR